ncbi:MAG: BRCT domain-containing protein [Thermoanaerobacter sp.]|nr:BRCT domain-containing protein [Thermoanaerobacter sp.]
MDMDYDSLHFRKYTYKAELDKALHTLEGILTGISIDGVITQKEIDELTSWCKRYSRFAKKHPFNELMPIIAAALDDGVLNKEEIEDLLWLCNNFKTGSLYYNIITTDIQKLQGILHGILADNVITKEEIVGLQEWLEENSHLTGNYPYDEINSIVTTVLADGILSDDEKRLLKAFFTDFVDVNSSKNINKEEVLRLKKETVISGICAVCPEISIPDKVFCFTGISSKASRRTIKDTIESLGGVFSNSVSKKTDYLIVGDNGNPCWAFACYGRKIEEAVKLRKAGHRILIVHENDFWDSLEDYVTR